MSRLTLGSCQVLFVKFRQVTVCKNHYCRKSGALPVGFDFKRMCKDTEREEWINRDEHDKRFRTAEALKEPWLARIQRMVKRTSKLSLDGRKCKWGSRRGLNEQKGGWTRRPLQPWKSMILLDRCQCSVWVHQCPRMWTGKIILEVERLATEALSARIALHLKCSMWVPELLNLFPGHGLLVYFLGESDLFRVLHH